MSGVSSRVNSVSSTLKASGVRAQFIKQPGKVYFELPKDVKNILCNSANSDGIKEYEKLILLLKEGAIKDSDLTEFLTEARQCIFLLDIKHESFVQALLQIEWTNRSPEVISTYKFFLQDLVRMQTIHKKLVLNRLIELIKPAEDNNAEHEIGQFKSEEVGGLIHIYDILLEILKEVPTQDITRFIEMEIEKKEQTQRFSLRHFSTPRLEPKNSSSESFTFLQKTINDPTNVIVQHQIQGNTAKILVMLTTGEQRLMAFDIRPNEDCTVHDLLDQARAVLRKVNISFPSETQVSLVDDPALGINYIVKGGVMHTSSLDGSDGDCNSTQEIVSTIANAEKLPQNINTSDENSNTSSQTPEEPILVKGMLALCPHCGYSSLHFNRCERCNTKLKIEEVKPVPITERKETGMSVDMFYKKNNSERNVKLEKIERDGPTCKRPRGKGKSAASKPKPIHKEPECLTISSDEEEGGKTKKIGSTNSNAVVGNATDSFTEDADTILDKEPIITNTSPCDEFTMDNEENSKDIGQLPQTALECRTVRIGSYKYIPREKVVISHTGVRFSVPLLEDDTSFVTLDVKYRDIVKLLIHFGKTMPVLFFYTSINTGTMIRELLGMQDPKGPYYDPAGKDHTHKHITLLPDKLLDDSKAILTSLFSRGDKIGELNLKEANDIFTRESPRDIKYLAVCKMSTEDNQKNLSTSHPGPNVEDPKLQEYYTDEKIESLLIENLYVNSQLKQLHPKMSTEDNQKNPSTSHPGPNVEDRKLQEYYTDEKVESLLIEHLYLKNKQKRLHLILKMFSHKPKVAEYLQQYNVK